MKKILLILSLVITSISANLYAQEESPTFNEQVRNLSKRLTPLEKKWDKKYKALEKMGQIDLSQFYGDTQEDHKARKAFMTKIRQTKLRLLILSNMSKALRIVDTSIDDSRSFPLAKKSVQSALDARKSIIAVVRSTNDLERAHNCDFSSVSESVSETLISMEKSCSDTLEVFETLDPQIVEVLKIIVN